MKTFNQLKKELYPGQPSSNGFPDNPPPEMVNGWHPSLVDGKYVSNRFNRLDPISAKAMPLTGNPHIDKKVKEARRQKKDFNYNIFPHSKKINKSSIKEKKYNWRNKIREEIILNAKGVTTYSVIREGMTSKGFEYIYGLQVSSIFVPGVHGIQSTIASDILQASSDTTDHRFGPEFPGSYVNTLGDNPISSYSKVDAVAFLDTTYGNVNGGGNLYTLTTGPEGLPPENETPPGSVVSKVNLETALGISLPAGVPNGNLGGTPIEGSAIKRIFDEAKPGKRINFNWTFVSSEDELGPQSVDDYAFVAIKGKVTKLVSVLTRGLIDSGQFIYTVKPEDIVNGSVEVGIGIMDVFDPYVQTAFSISNFGTFWSAGSLGNTTDAADLGMSIAAADPNKKKTDYNYQNDPNYQNNYNYQIAQLQPGPSGYKAPGTYDPNQFYPYSPPGVQPNQQPSDRFIPSPNLPQTGPGLSQSDQDTQIAQLKPIQNPTTPGDREWNKYLEDLKKGKDSAPFPLSPTPMTPFA